MTVDQAIDQLIKDLNAFKQSVRNGDEESQNNSLKLLDEVIASDRNLQQSFSKCIYHLPMILFYFRF